ncbi:MAG TPA: alpha-2-macroglobulin family protein, partial [Gaiellaceae bacterium]|nr:alpha-2-macroglobulin family protein [Gaiellaceae bacterium]
IPMRLDPGAYVVEVPRRTGAAQLLLQVSYVAAYAVSTDTRTVVWVNNLSSVAPVAGATVSLRNGRDLETTNNEGVAQFATPAELLPRRSEGHRRAPPVRLLTVRAQDGRAIVVALGSPVSYLDGEYDSDYSAARTLSEQYWLLLETDRDEYSQTDTINVWGLVRPRDGGASPRTAELQLRPGAGNSGTRDLAIARIPLSLSGRGAFTAEIPIADLPRSYYMLDLIVDGRVADSRWLTVDEIVKPAYRLEVATDLHAYLDGDPLAITIRATFFDGTAVPGAALRVRASEAGGRVTVTTDAEGVARTTLRASFPSWQPSGFNHQGISARPARPEEGRIYASTSVVVFPSTAWLTTRGTLDQETLTIKGSLTRVEFDELNASYDPGSWRWPSGRVADGRPVAGQTVTARVTQFDWVKRQTGTRYDYIEKRVVQIFDWRQVEHNLGSFEVETGSDGRYVLSLPVPSASSSYEINVRATDAAGRPVMTWDYVSARRYPYEATSRPFLIRVGCGYGGSTSVGLDEAADLTFHDANGSPAEGRFLWLVANRGLRDVETTNGPKFSRTMRTADLPRFTVRGVQVTSEGYATADASVYVDLDDLTIHVSVIPDRDRYAPGDRASVEVRTTGPDGEPIAADVVVQGIDEKLYAIGAASRPDVLSSLHRWVSDGFLQSFASHRIPSRENDGGCGATGGGGEPRSDFGDFVTFQLITTGADGRGTASFDLLDDLTSWRITAMAVSRDLKAGVGSTKLPVSLPFFVESVLATEYLAGEVPILRLRTYGDALGADDAVRFA